MRLKDGQLIPPELGEGWIGVDLDGTLAQYNGWVDIASIGAPIPRMVSRVKRWLELGYEVRIFTARICSAVPAIERQRGIVAIKSWCREHIGQELAVTSEKDLNMQELWDDRAVQVEFNTGMLLAHPEELEEATTP